MRITNMSVPEIVRETITRNRSIFDCLKMDLINYTALAVKIQPEIERSLGNSVNLNTIVVAIKRFADSL
ncbi:MAG: ACT domain-containing protein, partial [Nitrosopumilaceae archaeon]|nr:ACT domain-containing protein [Nitrosopumilaceae archaeon]